MRLERRVKQIHFWVSQRDTAGCSLLSHAEHFKTGCSEASCFTTVYQREDEKRINLLVFTCLLFLTAQSLSQKALTPPQFQAVSLGPFGSPIGHSCQDPMPCNVGFYPEESVAGGARHSMSPSGLGLGARSTGTPTTDTMGQCCSWHSGGKVEINGSTGRRGNSYSSHRVTRSSPRVISWGLWARWIWVNWRSCINCVQNNRLLKKNWIFT